MCNFTIKNLRKMFTCFVFFMTGTGMVFGQDTVPEQTIKKPLEKAPFESGYFIADQTVVIPPAKSLEFVIQHDFGTIQNGKKDFDGLWGASNIRLGLNFSINKNVLIGLGTTKNKRLQDLQVKYTFLRQHKKGIPLSIFLPDGWLLYSLATFFFLPQ